MANYKCNQCGHTFKSGDYIDECPKCQSRKIEPVESALSGFLKQNWRIIAVSALVILVVILVFILLTDNQANSKYQVTFSGFNDGIEIIIYEYALDKSGEPGKRSRLSSSEAEDIIDAYQFRVTDNAGRDVTLEGTKIYPCPDDKTDTLVLRWQNSKKFPLRNPENTEEVYYFNLKSSKPNSKANCSSPQKPLRILSVEPVKNCKLKVATNKDNKEVKISITGKNGKYREKLIWNAEDYDRINVWAAFEGDTVAFQRNGDKFQAYGCMECTQETLNAMKNKLTSAGNSYGANPGDRDKMSQFKDILSGEPTFYIDGEKIGVWADFYNELRMRYQNNRATYKFSTSGLKINSSNCTIERIEFVKQ